MSNKLNLWLKDEINQSILIVKAKYIKENYLIDVVINQFNINFDLEQTIQANKIDISKNLWIINPYSEKNHTIAAIRLYSEEIWLHIAAPNDKSYLPQEMTIDMMGLAWFGFQYASNLDISSVYSEGGIKVLDTKNTFDNTMDDLWLTIENPNVLPNGKNTSIWSITSDSYNRIWVLTSDGIQGYLYSKNNSSLYLIPLYQQSDGALINFLSFLSFNKGDKIRIDAQDNIWVTTKNDGVFLILNNTFLSPHIAGNFKGYQMALIKSFIENLNRYLDKKSLKNRVCKKRLY